MEPSELKGCGNCALGHAAGYSIICTNESHVIKSMPYDTEPCEN